MGGSGSFVDMSGFHGLLCLRGVCIEYWPVHADFCLVPWFSVAKDSRFIQLALYACMHLIVAISNSQSLRGQPHGCLECVGFLLSVA